MIIPSGLKVGPFTYRIELKEQIVDGPTVLYGTHSQNTETITLATAYGKARMGMTLIHEVIHALEQMFEIDLEEKEVDLLAKGLYMVLTDNGLLKEE